MIIQAWLERAAQTRPAVGALETPQGSCTYPELLAAARSGAAALAERGAEPGARVAIALPPGLAFAQALLGEGRKRSKHLRVPPRTGRGM